MKYLIPEQSKSEFSLRAVGFPLFPWKPLKANVILHLNALAKNISNRQLEHSVSYFFEYFLWHIFKKCANIVINNNSSLQKKRRKKLSMLTATADAKWKIFRVHLSKQTEELPSYFSFPGTHVHDETARDILNVTSSLPPTLPGAAARPMHLIPCSPNCSHKGLKFRYHLFCLREVFDINRMLKSSWWLQVLPLGINRYI